MFHQIRTQVQQLLGQDNSGHDMAHIDRVLSLSLRFATRENANQDVVALIALLHDVDDYKLFGAESAQNLTNASSILEQVTCSKDDVKRQVLSAIGAIGYGKRLDGLQPATLEGKIVSDADMCDALGATGLFRLYRYNLAHGYPVFDRGFYPSLDMSTAEYAATRKRTVISHMFEKLLRLKDLMLTDSGKAEAATRHEIMVEFLYHFFREENAPEWIDYLTNYLQKQG